MAPTAIKGLFIFTITSNEMRRDPTKDSDIFLSQLQHYTLSSDTELILITKFMLGRSSISFLTSLVCPVGLFAFAIRPTACHSSGVFRVHTFRVLTKTVCSHLLP
jgi:hypothetical protein